MDVEAVRAIVVNSIPPIVYVYFDLRLRWRSGGFL